MRKYFGFVMSAVLMLAILGIPVVSNQVAQSQHRVTPETVSPKIAKVSVTCGNTVMESVDEVTLQASFRYETARARVYWTHCWSSTGAHYINPIAVRGGYEITGGSCGDNLRLDGYRFNFGYIGGYNVPTFFVSHQADCGNHQTINIESESNLIPAYTTGACWGSHVTQVWNFANDIERDLSNCMNY